MRVKGWLSFWPEGTKSVNICTGSVNLLIISSKVSSFSVRFPNPKMKFIFADIEGIKGSKITDKNLIKFSVTKITVSDLFEAMLSFSHGFSSYMNKFPL